MTDDAMAELGRTREELRAALRKGVKGTRADDRIDHLVDQHQAALKTVLAHRLAEQQRAFLRSKGTVWTGSIGQVIDHIDPEAQR
jgi:hypothetical protein